MTQFRPMLSGKANPENLRFPLLASPKLDGVRCLAMDGKPKSRTLKDIPNRFIQEWFQSKKDFIEGMDGELIVGSATAKDAYRTTNSAVMTFEGKPKFSFWVFDLWDVPDASFQTRQKSLSQIFSSGPDVFDSVNNVTVRLLKNTLIHNLPELLAYEQKMLAAGYEGVMLRDPNSPYKHGRSSEREGYLLKLKRFSDAEAEIIGTEEHMHNDNVAFKDELGRTKRSSHQENQIGTNTLGAFVCKGINEFSGVEFKIGTGLDAAQRKQLWLQRNDIIGKVIKYKYFDIGVKDAPRHPVFLGFRDPIDM